MKHKLLKTKFIELLTPYYVNDSLFNELWAEIEENYTKKGRHYHTLEHLTNLLSQLNEVKSKIQDWESILFALFYHDIIYNALKANNELKSAELAKKRLIQLSVNNSTITHCFNHILATKNHTKSINDDTNYFLDADLSILGKPWDTYSLYIKNIRKEYAIYPDLIYNSGRKKVIQHFLNMENIFKSNFFIDKYELKAKQNLIKELSLLL